MNTKLLFTLIGLLLAGTTLSAESSVWKATKNRRTVYLGGTCDLLRPSDYPLPKEFEQAFAASSQIVFETDLVRLQTPEVQQLLTSRAVIDDGNTLDRILSPESWKSVQEFCGMAGIPEDNMSKAKAWRCRAMLTSVEMQKLGVTTKGMDAYFFQKAFALTKVVAGLDSIEKHLDYLTHPGTGRESELIDYTLKEISGLSTKHEAVIKAWKTGDLSKLNELLLTDLRQDHPALLRELVTQRTNEWLPKIELFYQTPRDKFVLVGIDHLVGPDGLLAQMRQRGYTVEQFKAE